MPARCCGLVACLCVIVDLKKNHKKIIWRNTVVIYNVFKKKTTKIILEKKNIKKMKGKKTM
jgi:hypothetical protein